METICTKYKELELFKQHLLKFCINARTKGLKYWTAITKLMNTCLKNITEVLFSQFSLKALNCGEIKKGNRTRTSSSVLRQAILNPVFCSVTRFLHIHRCWITMGISEPHCFRNFQLWNPLQLYLKGGVQCLWNIQYQTAIIFML
jgi:hypothetical protein